MTELTGPRLDAQNGAADALVIFLHGYGSDGSDLIRLGEVLAEHLPSVTFIAPNAPDPCANNPTGFQWFPIPWLDGSSEEESEEGAERAVDLLNNYLDEVAEREAIAPDRTLLVGFSQGTMLSLHIGPRRKESLAGIVGFSGRLLVPERLEDEIESLPPILLVHGDQDDMVPKAATALQEQGLTVYGHVSEGTGHSIAPDGLGVALTFIRQMLDMGVQGQD